MLELGLFMAPKDSRVAKDGLVFRETLPEDIPLAWSTDWQQILALRRRAGDNTAFLVVEVPDLPWGWAYQRFTIGRQSPPQPGIPWVATTDLPIMVSSREKWSREKLLEFNRAMVTFGRPGSFARILRPA